MQLQKEVKSNQNSPAVKVCGPEKRCEIQGGGQEMAVMLIAKFLTTAIQIN